MLFILFLEILKLDVNQTWTISRDFDTIKLCNNQNNEIIGKVCITSSEDWIVFKLMTLHRLNNY